MTPDALTPLNPAPSKVDIQRVAHFTDTYLPRRDGVVASLHTLRDALETDGCHGLIVAARHPGQPDREGLLTVGSVPCGVANLRLGRWPTARQVERIAAWRPQLIHVHTPGPVGLLGVLAARRLGLPLVHTYHTDLHAYAEAYRVPATALRLLLELYARRLGGPRPRVGEDRISRRHAVLDAANELLLGGADAVVVPTAAVLARARLPVAPHKLFLVPAAVAPGAASPVDVADFRAHHGLPATGKTVLFVGRVNREKGIELLLAAFAHVLRRVPGARLVLVGAVYEPRWLHRLLDHHRLHARVVVTGQLRPTEVAAAYACADVFAFPSRTDTQGLVLQEAALAGVPSVVADPELHRAGALGGASVLADYAPQAYGDSIVTLLADEVTARHHGALARQRAQIHTPARYAATMREVYTLAASRTVATPQVRNCVDPPTPRSRQAIPSPASSGVGRAIVGGAR